VIESLPTGRVEVASVAVLLRPLPGARVAVPIEVVPFMKVTVPVGAPLGLVIVPVKVTDWPVLEGFSEDATVAVVLAAVTTWLIADEVEAPKSAVAA
jgi:hypothetical protein